jgi:hypothetical protein
LKRPASSEPIATRKGRFHVQRRLLGVWDVRKINIALDCSSVPLEHRVDSLRELGQIITPDAASINPEITQAILLRPLCAKSDFIVPNLALSSAVHKILERDLFVVCTPRMGKYTICGEVIVVAYGQARFSTIIKFQKTHLLFCSSVGRSETSTVRSIVGK